VANFFRCKREKQIGAIDILGFWGIVFSAIIFVVRQMLEYGVETYNFESSLKYLCFFIVIAGLFTNKFKGVLKKVS
jgi:hypothetical protein